MVFARVVPQIHKPFHHVALWIQESEELLEVLREKAAQAVENSTKQFKFPDISGYTFFF